jgi:RNA polymerase-binding transcription factor DksA
MITEEQIAGFRLRLEVERDDLLNKIKSLDDELAQNDYDYPLDWVDGAVRLYSEEDVMFERNRLDDELARVEHALERIKAGNYGFSEVSGKPIPIERLEALPTATTLVDESPPDLSG